MDFLASIWCLDCETNVRSKMREHRDLFPRSDGMVFLRSSRCFGGILRKMKNGFIANMGCC